MASDGVLRSGAGERVRDRPHRVIGEPVDEQAGQRGGHGAGLVNVCIGGDVQVEAVVEGRADESAWRTGRMSGAGVGLGEGELDLVRIRRLAEGAPNLFEAGADMEAALPEAKAVVEELAMLGQREGALEGDGGGP